VVTETLGRERLEERPEGLENLEALPPAATKAALVRDRIRGLIERGQLAPGERVNVDAIARALGISKIPVREAISQLEAMGLLVVTPHAGARVAQATGSDLHGLYLIRQALEPLAASLAARSITAEQLASLEETGRQMAAAQRAGNAAGLSDANRAFHAGLARASGYRPLADMVEETLRRIAPYHSRLLSPKTWRRALTEHAALLEALRARDPGRAEALARAHVGQPLDDEAADRLFGLAEAQATEESPEQAGE
jgi:DNA-binding GntR family transcriptional regulator